MKQGFKQIGIIGKHNDHAAHATLEALLAYLRSDHDIVPYVEASTAKSQEIDSRYPIKTLDELGTICDLVMVVGGDGNMLHAARSLSKYDVHVVGINRGHLGFLTDIHPQSIGRELDAILAGDYTKEQRFLITGTVSRNGKVVCNSSSLNDIVLSQAGIGRMIEFQVYINDEFVHSQRSDGVIVSTPTGSTAYALSASGPILHPELDAIALVPMFPHTLSSRPVVVKGESEIKIIYSSQNLDGPNVSFDGQGHFKLQASDEIVIKKSAELLTLIHPKNYSYYEALRSKLQWGHKL